MKPITLVLLAAAGCASAGASYLFGNTDHNVVSLITNQGTFLTSDDEFLAGVPNSGWWSLTAPNSNYNSNYFTGAVYGRSYSDFFTFFIPSGLGEITSAVLSAPRGINGYFGDTVGVPFIFSVFDVGTPAAVLNTKAAGPNSAIFHDLGSGVLYGSVGVSDLSYPDPLTVTLNSAALSALNATDGAYISIGGTLTPEPGSQALLLIGTVCMAGLLRLRAPRTGSR